MRHARRPLLLLGFAAAFALAPASAHAYPQWQFSSGAARCNQCHYAPGGGGLVTTYGRDAIGTELSTIEGNGAFLHGGLELPARLALGGDLRGAFVSHDSNEITGSRRAVFPMQADLSGRLVIWEGLSFAGTVGLRGQQRDNQQYVPFQNYQPIYTSRLVTREHYFMWQPAPQGYYARAGRFFAPFGLRLAEHTTYVRRDLGFNQLEESYNLSGGYVTGPWELHVTAFAPDVLRHIGGSDSGVAAYYEHRILDDAGALAAQTRVAIGDGTTRIIGGGVAKYYVPLLRTLFLAEGNLVHWRLDDGLGRNQFVGAGGFAVLPVRGLMMTMLAERNQEDVAVKAAAWSAATALLNFFPYPHVELQMMGRLQFPGAGVATKTFFVQLHYFL
jgi:hypothetical protein